MPDVYVDTTVIVEALLKTRKRREAALRRLRENHSTVSVYAFKELKGGPLQYWTWVHNKLVTTKSLKKTYAAIGQNLRQKYRAGTALEALQVGAEALGLADYSDKKSAVQRDRENADVYALAIRRRIIRGWGDRKKIVTEVTGDVDCFSQASPYFDETQGLIENPQSRCPREEDCGFGEKYRSQPQNLKKMIRAIQGMNRPEDNRRRAALHKLLNTPKWSFTDPDCRNLGDAHFVLTCPKDAEILTSNYKDHEALAAPLGVRVQRYLIEES